MSTTFNAQGRRTLLARSIRRACSRDSSFAQRSRLALGSTALIAGLAFAATAPVHGQEAESGATTGAQAIDEIRVTGSRIVRRDLISPSPVSTVDASEFQYRGAVNVEEVLSELPQTVPGFGAGNNEPSEIGRGVATVDLRGLGSARTLTMVNGRRWMGADVFGTTDLNTIPPALIERVEVVTGGASAVYGSDAVAGVVNFITRTDFEGFEIEGQFDVSARGDGERWTTSAIMGSSIAGGRGNVTAVVSYSERTEIRGGDRGFTSQAFGETAGQLSRAASAFIPANNVSDVPLANALGAAGDSNLFFFNNNGEAVPYNAQTDAFNFAPDNFLQVPQERWQIHTAGHVEVIESVRAYIEGTYVNNNVPTIRAATPANIFNLEVNPNSPFFAPDVQAAMNSLLEPGEETFNVNRILRRMLDLGDRELVNRRSSWRVLGGLEGDLPNDWVWDLNYQFARMEGQRLQDNGFLISRFRQAVLVTDDGLSCQDPSNGCVPLNIWGPDVASEEGLDWIRGRGTNVFDWEQQVAMGSVSGGVGDWFGAGEVGVAFGLEWRKQSATFRPDVVLASGDLENFRQTQATEGSFDVTEVFGEVVLPLLSDMPGVRSLEASAAVRFSDYSTAGTVQAFAGGLSWQPVEDVLVRTQFQRAVRAPNVGELFRGTALTPTGVDFPCTDVNPDPEPGLVAICEALGVPAGETGTFSQATNTIPVILGGNPDLVEEESDTWTVGVVFTPSGLPGFSASLDYYSIEIDDAIDTLGGGAAGVLDFCFNELRDPDSPFCQAVILTPDGRDIDEIRVNDANIAALKTTGIDLAANYGFDLGFGLFGNTSTLDVTLLATRVLTKDVTPVVIPERPDLETKRDCLGAFGTVCGRPDHKLRTNTRLTWSTGPLQLSANWRRLSSATDARVQVGGIDPASIPVPKIGSENYVDITARYSVTENFQLTVGATNVFDNKPTLLPGASSEQLSTFPDVYDVVGTRFFFGARATF